MIQKTKEKELVISLRKEGQTYSEIMKVVPVAKSSIALWLRDVSLAKHQIQRITEKRLAGQRRAVQKIRENGHKNRAIVHELAKLEIDAISKRELWLMGTMLYWAEGGKDKSRHFSNGIQFSNSDPRMIRLFLRWLSVCCDIIPERIRLEIYIHESHSHRIPSVIKYWAEATGFSEDSFTRIYFKKGNIKTKRKNVGENYFGLVRVVVSKSTTLLRRVIGWIDGVVQKGKMTE